MKQILLSLCVLFIVLSLFSCQSVDVSSASTSLAKSQQIESDESVRSDYELLTLSTKEEYDDFIATAQLPDYFVPYDQISALGSFGNFVNLYGLGDMSYLEYKYDLVTESGNTFMLYVSHEEINLSSQDQLTAHTQLMKENLSSDLRTRSDEQTGVMTLNGFTYYYLKGKLRSITWYTDNARLRIYGDYLIEEPIGEPHANVLSRLLVPETAEAAMTQLTTELQEAQ